MAPVTRRKQAEMEANSSIIEEPSPAPKSSASKPTASKRDRKLALRGKEEEMSPSKSVSNKGTVTVFDDEEINLPALVAEKVVSERAAPADVDEEDEDESDDDAPEAVSTTKAASEIKAVAKATQKAAQEQATAQKRKRKERDALLKKQAEERKRLVAEARSSPAGPVSDDDHDHDHEEDPASALATAAPPRPSGTSRRAGQLAVPALLPAELLTDSDSDSFDDEDDAAGAPVRSKPKRRKVAAVERSLARLDRAPQDATIGSTVYQVARTADGRLPPKAKQLSKSTKEMLLKRNRAPTKQRRQGAGGFLTKR